MLLNMIAAVARETFAIGFEGKLPWHFPPDLKVFKQVTDNTVIIVGKRTALNLPELPNRTIATWDGRVSPQDFLLNLEATGIRCAWLCGGEYTYEQFAPLVNGAKVISYVDYTGPADAYFPMESYGLT